MQRICCIEDQITNIWETVWCKRRNGRYRYHELGFLNQGSNQVVFSFFFVFLTIKWTELISEQHTILRSEQILFSFQKPWFKRSVQKKHKKKENTKSSLIFYVVFLGRLIMVDTARLGWFSYNSSKWQMRNLKSEIVFQNLKHELDNFRTHQHERIIGARW